MEATGGGTGGGGDSSGGGGAQGGGSRYRTVSVRTLPTQSTLMTRLAVARSHGPVPPLYVKLLLTQDAQKLPKSAYTLSTTPQSKLWVGYWLMLYS